MLKRDQYAHVLGIIDCDGRDDRISKQLDKFPDGVRNRIFLLGAIGTPEQLRAAVNMKAIEIGQQFAEECVSEELKLWNHEHLKHIAAEVCRVKDVLRSIVFDL